MWKNDTVEQRSAYVANNITDKNIDNKRMVTLNIVNTLPIIMIDNTLVDRNQIAETTVDLDTVVLNTLVGPGADAGETDPAIIDAKGPGRYNYVTTVESSISRNVMRVYYDTMFKDMVIVPDLMNFGADGADNPNNGKHYYLDCYRVAGGGTEIKEDMYKGGLNKVSSTELPLIDTAVAGTHMAVRLNGIAPFRGDRHTSLYLTHNSITNRVSDSFNNPSGLLSLGDSETLFGGDVKVPLYNVYLQNKDNYRLKYLGFNKVPKIYVLLDF